MYPHNDKMQMKMEGGGGLDRAEDYKMIPLKNYGFTSHS